MDEILHSKLAEESADHMIWELPIDSKLKQVEIKLDDTTLRDGEQTAGVVFTNQEKITIAKMLDEVGVAQIEAGIPVMGGDEAEVITEIAHMGLKASVLGWNSASGARRKRASRCRKSSGFLIVTTSP